MQGAKLSSKLLEGTGKGMRHVTVEAKAHIDEKEINRLIREAGKLATAKPVKSRAKVRRP